MKKHILFLHGGGDDGYEEDAKLVASLQATLGDACEIHYPHLSSDENLPDLGWPQQIAGLLPARENEVIVVAHSLGASMLLKCLSENQVQANIAGIFLLAAPFWSGDANWVRGLKLQNGFESKLSRNIPLFFYHCKDDEEVPFAHMDRYRQKLPWAVYRELPNGGHQLNNDLRPIAKDIMETLH